MSLLPFVPRLALRLLRDADMRPDHSRGVQVSVAVLLADLSGFTDLVDSLAARHGDRGAERVQEILNQCFGLLTDIVDAHRGEVLSFPGDAALAIWTADDERTSLNELLHRCAFCGLELAAKLHRFQVGDDIELRMRVAIGAGRAWAALVGGVEGRYETVLQGEAVDQLAGTLHAARPGEVVLSATAGTLAGDRITTAPREDRLVVTSAQPPAALPTMPTDRALTFEPELIRSLVPLPVLSRLDAGLHSWLAEFRNATVIFVHIRSRGSADHGTLQQTVRVVQTVVARFGGSVNQAVADEKGLTIVIAFGVVSHAHEDDPVRAVRTALLLRDELQAAGVDARFGLATGRVFVGRRGGTSRFEFALMGASIVLAARLASVAEDILCDATTRGAARKAIRFGSVVRATLKGKANPVDAWRPRAIKGDARDASLVGRRDERAALERRLMTLEREGLGGVVVLEGEAGIGKTALLKYLLNSAQSRATRILTGAGDSIERRTAYVAWRPAAAGLLGADVACDSRALHARLIELLGADNAPWLPLLNPLFAASQPENEHTLSMNAESRAQTTRDLMIGLLESAARATPLLVALEDAHWMDSASWDLAEQVVARIPRLLLLLSVRPSSDAAERLERLAKRPDATTIRLGALSDHDIRELVCRRLDAEDIPDQLDAFIHLRAEGHPFFAEELSVALRDGGAVVVRDGTCRLTGDITELAAHLLPDNVHGIVATRIDQLPPQQQLTLKVAAILGRHFALAELSTIHPLSVAPDVLREHILAIAEAGLLIRQTERDDSFSFSHALVQEVSYELLPYTQRRELHRRAAEWLEEQTSRNPDEITALLAHHWHRAEVVGKAMHYLEKAGERALMRDSSNREAEEFLTRLIALAENPVKHAPDDGPQHERPSDGRAGQVSMARWERMLSQAVGRQGRHAPAMQHLERSLTLLGQHVPSPTLACRSEFVRGIMARLLWRPSRVTHRRRSDTEQLELLELTRAYDSFVQLLYLGIPSDDTNAPSKRDVFLISCVAVLRSLRAAERAGPSAELSRTYSLFASVVAIFRRQALAAHYAAQGRAVAEEVGDRHALFCALTVGQLPAFIRGGWLEAAEALEQGLALGAELRNVHDCLIYEGVLAYISFNQGRLEEALDRFRAIRARARRDDHLVPQLWSMISIAEVAFRQGHLDDAIAAAEECLALAERTNTVDQNSRFQAHGLLASAWLRKGDPDRARRHLAPAIAAADAGARLSYTPQFGFVGVAEMLLADWDRGGDQAQPAKTRLRRWLRILRVMAFCRPILAPWDLLFRAQWNERRHRPWLALRRLRQAIQAADRMGLTYESALAHAEFGRLRSSRVRLESTHPD
jgi:class 3 adenylate cyclase/tetratricopeptide (TPR) repeat protein